MNDHMSPNGGMTLASLSLDLDNQWSYMKTHGDSGWEKFPSYFDIFVPSILDLLDQLKLKITFFVVGQDAALQKNKDALQQIIKRGHEIGNHSFHHEQWIHMYSKDQLRSEVLEAENHILKVSGQKPVGFRGPGFVWSRDLFEILIENGYLYDATTLATYLGPLARLYYFWTSELTKKEKAKRKKLFGNLKDGLRPVKPYLWLLPSGNRFLEIPVTTIPIIKTPFHLSYLLYLSRYSESLMRSYLRLALFFCRITRTSPSFLLHPLDFIGPDDVPELSFFPGMDLSKEHKIKIFKYVIKRLSHRFHLVNMSTHAEYAIKNKNLKTIKT